MCQCCDPFMNGRDLYSFNGRRYFVELVCGDYTRLYLAFDKKTESYILIADGDDEPEVEIFFCPMCGKRLEKNWQVCNVNWWRAED